MKLICSLLWCWVVWDLHGDDDRIWMDVSIKGQPVHLAFDTGANCSFLFQRTAERLQLKLLPPLVKPAGTTFATNPVTEHCEVAFGPLSAQMQFLVVNQPTFEDGPMEGVISWCLFRSNVFEFEAAKGPEFTNAVPTYALTWPKFKLRTDLDLLAFDVGGDDAQLRTIYVDTGDAGGIALNHTLWEKWVATHGQQPATMSAIEWIQTGVTIKQESWADKISIGALSLINVPVRELDRQQEFTDHAATLGLYALRRLDFVLDGKRGFVYVRPRGDVPPAYPHNRLGAVFDPGDDPQGALLAHVAPGSPAALAGIRDGDILLRIDDRVVTKWRTDPEIQARRYWEQAPGTTYRLTLKRGADDYQATVTLKSILGPAGENSASLSPVELRPKAERGDAQAQERLGLMYFFGLCGLPVDKPEGIKWWRLAAAQGNASAQSKLGLAYHDGGGVAKDEAEAIKWWRLAAAQRDANAQFFLGSAYADGKGVAKDETVAVKWLRLAAIQNDAAAQSKLGYLYVRGVGIKKDEVEAVIWFRKAAQQNEAGAQANLSNCYAYGIGVPKDLVQAGKWMLLAARQGNQTAAKDVTKLSNQMTREQFQEAQRLAGEFQPIKLPQVK